MGMRFAPEVRWRVSQRGLVIGGIEGDALLLEHPRAGALPDLLDDRPSPDELATRLGAPRAPALVAEMLEVGVLVDGAAGRAAAAGVPAGPPGGPDGAASRRVILTRSGAEFPGIERPARWIDRRLVPWGLSWPGRLLLAAVVVAGVVGLSAGRPDGPVVSAHPVADALLGLLIMLGRSALHELAHAVALVHFGRRPRRAGFGFYWGGVCFYVDSTEALTLPRRERVVQALVGLAVDVVTVSVLVLVAQLSGTVLVVTLCWRLAVTGVINIVINALPILEVDGHWALADHLDEPELAPRARAALGAALRARPHAAEPSTPRWLAAYGAASLVGGLVLLVGSALAWWGVTGDLVSTLFAGGVVDVVAGLVLVGPLAASLLISAAGLVLEVAVGEASPAG